ncbi:energy transducer TonB [Cryomorpha ignava]|uniref:Energy transducer TonB n=1 Tax=Cryomorpha ignava TaxID=101383 RepID=A0A7K3WUR9_9FLAO|nr:energy transducer TonB [Cryomorpha ignava]NEN25288.1 energy transducer TonB [Cryomorpha ignava]
MKTKKLFLLAIGIVFTSYCFSQEISENYLNNLSLTEYDYHLEKAENLEKSDRRATFSKSPKYKSLQQFINLHIEFPDDARLIGISGSVIAQFEILGDGSLGEIYFVQSPDLLLSQEVERVLRMAPQFIPAIKNGKIVPSFEQVKINFTLQ